MSFLITMIPVVVTLLVAFTYSHDFNIDNQSRHPSTLLHVSNEDLISNNTLGQEIIKQLSSGLAVVFEHVEVNILQKILQDAQFPTYPNEQRHYFMAHVSKNDKGFKIYHTKEYMHYYIKQQFTASNINGVTKQNVTDSLRINVKGPLYDQYVKDVIDYNKHCVSAQDNNECTIYINEWNNKYGFKNENGMVPVNSSSCWGLLQQTTYVDDSVTSFSSLIPFDVYIYAEANPATLELLDMLIYIIAEGLHSQKPACNTNGCRGYAHREIWVNITAKPLTSYNISSYHWIYSQPETENQQTQITTQISDTTSMGLSGSFSEKGFGITFGEEYSWTNSYSTTTDVSDFGVIEDTDPTTSDGKWRFYEQYPVNILEYPFENFSNDWEKWYSSTNDDNLEDSCDVINGPDLAFNSQQTSTAIKWNAAPEIIDYQQQSLNLKYFTNVMADVAILWCPDWNGQPANACNQQQGGSHHCVDWYYVEQKPSWTSNVIQVMNNLAP